MIFWQFTIKTLDELNVVSNQNISVEMFLIRLINLLEVTKINEQKTPDKEKDLNFINNNEKTIKQIEDNFDFKNKTISQIKNIYQEENLKNQNQMEKKDEIIEINSFDELINICNEKKLIKLKYELETNVNLVKFESQRIEISFNDRLDKNFIKDLSEALYSLTQKRWIISLSKKDGDPSKKEKNKIFKSNQIIEVKKTDIYDKMIENFPDAELIDVKDIENQKND